MVSVFFLFFSKMKRLKLENPNQNAEAKNRKIIKSFANLPDISPLKASECFSGARGTKQKTQTHGRRMNERGTGEEEGG